MRTSRSWGSVLEVRTVVIASVEYYIWRMILFCFFVYLLYEIWCKCLTWLMNFDRMDFFFSKLLIWKYLLSCKIFGKRWKVRSFSNCLIFFNFFRINILDVLKFLRIHFLLYIIDIFSFFILLLLKFLCKFYILAFVFIFSLFLSLFTFIHFLRESFWIWLKCDRGIIRVII